MDDSELLSAYLEAGSEDAFASLVDRHVKMVYSAALRQVGGDAHLAKDVVQNVFTALARKASALRDRKVLSGWLYTSTCFAAAETVRGERRRQAREQAAELIKDADESVAPDIWDRLRPALDQAMNELNVRDRQAILLRYFENRHFAEIGEKLGLNEDSARKRVERALDKMHGLLSRRGVASTATALGLALTEQAAGAAVPAGLAATVTGAALKAGASGAAAPPLVAILDLMTKTKITAGIGAIGLALVVGATVHQFRVLHRVSEDLIASSASYSAVRSRLDELQRQFKAIDEERSNLKAASAQQQPSVREPVNTRRPAPAALKKSVISQLRAQTAVGYGRLFLSLGLSQSQIDRFLDAVVSEPVVTITDDGALYFRVVSSGADTTAAALRIVLGSEGYKEYEEYQATTLFRDLADQVAGDALSAGNSLTPAQVNQLAQVLGNSSQGMRSNMGTGLPSINWDQAAPQLAGILSPDQMAAVDSVRIKTRYQIEQKVAMYPDQARTPAK